MLSVQLTNAASFGTFTSEPKNSSVKVRQHLKRGLFFGVFAPDKRSAFTVISGREWANRIPFGEYARRSQTVLSSRPFLRPVEGNLRKICEVPMSTSPKSNRVKAESVPTCFRHLYPGAALEDAQNLVAFLREATTALLASGISTSTKARIGLDLVYSLLQDKLSVSDGELDIPLWNPEQEEDVE